MSATESPAAVLLDVVDQLNCAKSYLTGLKMAFADISDRDKADALGTILETAFDHLYSGIESIESLREGGAS